MNIRQIQEARERYGIEQWGAGYYGVNDLGEVACHPTGEEHLSISLMELVGEAKKQGIRPPMILRFPQVIKSQMKRMHHAFSTAVQEFKYQGRHLGVFPFKVNQRREFIDAIVSCGDDLDWGLEVGSKTEFMAALSYPLSKNAILICNGFKDSEFIDMAFLAKSLGRNVILVVEGPDELLMVINQLKSKKYAPNCCPDFGIRVRLYSRGSGKWEKSSGETSKFGLTTVELLHALHIVEKEQLQDKLTMLHFHIGSQITAIKRFKNAIKEAATVYAKVHKMGFHPRYLNIGGGVGVDYDGSKTTSASSANYSLQEFANDAVYVIGEVCEKESVPRPNIVTESGRVIAAYHSVVVVDIREVQGEESLDAIDGIDLKSLAGTSNQKAITELEYIIENMNRKNYTEFYHDAVEYHEELFTLFNLGYLSLKERAYAEEMYHNICRKALYFSSFQRNRPEEFESLQKLKVSKYLANFSIFQSIPDAWSLDQLFPVLPLNRLGEKPTHKATIVDITCDSDGCVERFVDRYEEKSALDLHPPTQGPYYIGFFLVGAYQESLANEHNLFGAIHEAEAVIDSEGSWRITKITEGDPIDELLVCRNYDIQEMADSFKRQAFKSAEEGTITEQEAAAITEKLVGYFRHYPYLVERQV